MARAGDEPSTALVVDEHGRAVWGCTWVSSPVARPDHATGPVRLFRHTTSQSDYSNWKADWMDSERSRRIAARFGPDIGTPPNPSLCERCVEVMRIRGAGVSIMSGRNSGPVCSSSEQVRQLEDLQFSLGEGPCHDAYTSATFVAEPDLASRTTKRWPNYTPSALVLGACAVFAFPLQIGAGTVGVLTLYHDNIGPLTLDQTKNGRILAHTLPAIMATIQIKAPQTLMAGALSDADAHRAEVHQAAGMLAVQLHIDIEEALVRIRAHAYAVNDTVAHVAAAILAHRLYLGNDGPQTREHDHE